MPAAPQTVPADASRPSRLGALWRSQVGRKALMAVTGLVLALYVLVHMLANLQAFEGAARLDHYAAQLRVFPALLWTARAVLLVAVVLVVLRGVDPALGGDGVGAPGRVLDADGQHLVAELA